MQKDNEKKKYKIFWVVGIIVLILVVIDYKYYRIIPNTIFMNNYKTSYVASYWTGVISIFVSCLSIITFQQTSDKYFFEKKTYIDMQKKEAVRRYQDLLKSAIGIFCDKYESEFECLFAVQIIKNIIDLSINVDKERNITGEIEPFQVISLEGALGILKSHFDRVLALEDKSYHKRQDIMLIIDILYRNNYKWNKDTLKEIGIYSFKNLSLNIAYFDLVELHNADFNCVKFYGDESNGLFRLSSHNTFISCQFDCDINVFLYEYTSVTLDNCNLKGFKIYPEIGKRYDKTQKNGTKNLFIKDSIIEGFLNLSDNIFDSIQITHSKFMQDILMKKIEVDSEFIVNNTEFNDLLDFQSSVIRWKMEFTNTICKDMFFWDSLLLKRERINFNNFFVHDFDKGNFNVAVYEDPSGKLKETEMKKFGELYELIWNEEKKMYTLKLKENRK